MKVLSGFFIILLIVLPFCPTNGVDIPPELLQLATDFICYLPQHAFALISAVDMNELTQLQAILTEQLTPTLEYGNFTDINITALYAEIEATAPNSYAGIMKWLVPYKTRFTHLSSNSKRFIANSKKRIFALQSQTDELQTDYSITQKLINDMVTSWHGLPDSDQECLASFISSLKNAILSTEFDSFINSAAGAASQDELQLVVMDFATVVQNHTCSNPF